MNSSAVNKSQIVENNYTDTVKPSSQTSHEESESPIHFVKESYGDSIDNQMNNIPKRNEMFNEIESELVHLNIENDPQKKVCEQETVSIKETVKMDINNEEKILDEIPLNVNITTNEDNIGSYSMEEEPDTLSPLLKDSHTHIVHSEMLVNGHYITPIQDNEIHISSRLVTCLNPLARSFMRSTEQNECSFSDSSDISLQLGNNETHNDDFNDREESDNNKEERDGQNINDQDIEIPSDDICLKIVEQVEYYFSDESLLKDAFLLKHVRRNKEGFVSLKLVSSFKRVRQICKDWRAVGHAIKLFSKKIELNDHGTKIRRLQALPEYDETLPSRTIVTTGLPFDKLSIEKVSDLFSKCGEIALVRILRPGGQIPADVKQFMNKHPELLENECALVEFTESASARLAQQMKDIYVLEMVLPKKKTGKKSNVTKLVENLKYSSESDNERSRGGESTSMRYHLKRNNSTFINKEVPNTYIPRRMSFGNDNVNAFEHFQNKRIQNILQHPIVMTENPARRFSTCSDTYSCHDASRRSSLCSSELSRRFSNCSQESHQQPLRRFSNCTDFCSCNHRISQSSENSFRRMSHSSVGSDNFNRKFSGGSSFSTGSNCYQDRRFSNASESRRISVESNNGYERKISSNSMGSSFDIYNARKNSNGFDNHRKISNSDQYYMNGRRISTDSGYDRRMSFGSDVSGIQQKLSIPQSPVLTRGRSGSIFNAENIVRSPIGPDGSKGFMRTRRFGQVIPPV